MKYLILFRIQGGEAMTRLFSFHHGSSSVANYPIQLWIYADESGWNDSALRGAFLTAFNVGNNHRTSFDYTNGHQQALTKVFSKPLELRPVGWMENLKKKTNFKLMRTFLWSWWKLFMDIFLFILFKTKRNDLSLSSDENQKLIGVNEWKTDCRDYWTDLIFSSLQSGSFRKSQSTFTPESWLFLSLMSNCLRWQGINCWWD